MALHEAAFAFRFERQGSVIDFRRVRIKACPCSCETGLQSVKSSLEQAGTCGRVWDGGQGGGAAAVLGAADGGGDRRRGGGNASERESLIQSRKVPSALATLAALRTRHMQSLLKRSRRYIDDICAAW